MSGTETSTLNLVATATETAEQTSVVAQATNGASGGVLDRLDVLLFAGVAALMCIMLMT